MTLAVTIIVAGYVLMTLGGLWVVVEVWQISVPWGVGSLLFPPVELVFVALHWMKSRSGFLLQVFGFLIYIVGETMRQP